jgi:hypothetical protein
MDACLDAWVTPRLGEVEAPSRTAIDAASAAHAVYLASIPAVTPVWDALRALREAT